VGFTLSLLFVMLVMMEVGRRIGDRRRARGFEDDKAGLTTIEGAVFALFGLIVAFTFSGSATRLNEKRELIAEEANAIEVAYMRTQLLSEASRVPIRALFRDYADSRLAIYHVLPDMKAAAVELERSKAIRERIWSEAIAASTQSGAHPDAGKLLIPAINNMIDMATIRTVALFVHPPRVIYILLFGLGMLCSLLAGYRMSGVRHRSWLHIMIFALITVLVVYVLLDMEYPRAGFIQLDASDQFLRSVRESMH